MRKGIQEQGGMSPCHAYTEKKKLGRKWGYEEMSVEGEGGVGTEGGRSTPWRRSPPGLVLRTSFVMRGRKMAAGGTFKKINKNKKHSKLTLIAVFLSGPPTSRTQGGHSMGNTDPWVLVPHSWGIGPMAIFCSQRSWS